jgi:peptide/nickel transport system permease protein
MRPAAEVRPRLGLPGKVAQPARMRATQRRRASARPPYLWLGIITVLILFAVIFPMVSPYGQNTGSLSNLLIPPLARDPLGQYHLLGTDASGRDVATRLAYGARVSLIVGVVGTLLGAAVGSAAGLIAAALGRVADALVMRLVDITLSIPGVLIAILIATVTQPSLLTLFFVVGFLLWPQFARVVRAEALALRENDYVKYARVAGASRLAIARRHLLPNVVPTMLVLITLNVGTAILLEAAISFLGVGLPPTDATLGAMINDGRGYLDQWWLSVPPGLAIFLIVISLNMIGDWVRVRFDPRLRGA